MSFSAVNDKNEKNLMVIWDLGRKCTYACSYCPPHRKNSWSNTASLDELIATADSLERYANIYNKHRNTEFKTACSFTGGEPTVNPAFFDFLVYLQQRYPHWKRTLTTNGFYSERKLRLVMNNTDYTTVSWHCEGSPAQKVRVKDNLRIMYESGYGFKVNVMFHEKEEYFNECIELCSWLEERNINFTPRVIGDQGDVKQGLKDKTVHAYTPKQLEWMKEFWKKKSTSTVSKKETPKDLIQMESKPDASKKKIVGQSIGRPCCGGREMEILEDNKWKQTTFVPSNNFKDWSCMINWYFLYIHQEIDQVWHHQTCQVNLEGKLGPICKASELDKFCDTLETTITSTGSIPLIRCPKSHCGCGLCAPKAKDDEQALSIFKQHTLNIEPKFIKQQKEPGSGTLKTLVYAFDKKNGNETI